MTLNRYAYCKQDPVNYVDPSGHWSTADHRAISKAALSSNGYGNNQRMNDCVKDAVFWADDVLHYKNVSQDLEISERSKNRLDMVRAAIKRIVIGRHIMGVVSITNICRIYWGLCSSSKRVIRLKTLPYVMIAQYISK